MWESAEHISECTEGGGCEDESCGGERQPGGTLLY